MRYSPTRIWRLLQSSRSLGAVEKVWRESLGDEWEIFRSFIKPTNEIAKSYPCPSPGGPGCPRGIIEHGPDRYAAFCGQSPPECDTLQLKRADVIIHRFDVAAFARTLSGLFQFNAKPDQHDPYWFLWRVGKYIPVPGRRFPVFLSLAPGKDDFLPALDHLLADEKEPFVLLVPTDDYLDDPREDSMDNKNCLFIPLNETVVFNGNNLTLARPAQEILFEFRRGVLPEGYVEAGHTAILFCDEGKRGITDRDIAEILGPRKSEFDLIVDCLRGDIWFPKRQEKQPGKFRYKYYVSVLREIIESRSPVTADLLPSLKRVEKTDPNTGVLDDDASDKEKTNHVQRMRAAIEPDSRDRHYYLIKRVESDLNISAYHFSPDPGYRFALIFPPESNG